MKALADRWNALVDEAGSPGPALQNEVAEALQWVRRELGLDRIEAERDEARAKLSYLINSSKATRSQLDLAYEAARIRGGVDSEIDMQLDFKLEAMDRRFKVRAVGITIAAVVALFLFVIVAALATRPSTVVATENTGPKGEKKDSLAEAGPSEAERAEADRREAFERTMKELEQVRAESDAKDLIAEARRLARTAQESKLLQLRVEVIERQEKLAFGQKIGKLQLAANDLLVDALRLRTTGPSRRDIEELRGRTGELARESARLGSGEGELRRLEATLVEVQSWQALAKKLASLRAELKGARGTTSNIERLARFLVDEVAPIAPRSELARRASLAGNARAVWFKVFDLQALLGLGNLTLLSAAAKEWRGSPVSAALASASEQARAIRDRDPEVKGTAAFKLKARLGETDIAGLWMVRRFPGDTELIYYARHKPEVGSKTVKCLLEIKSPEVAMPLPEERVAEPAPQSIFSSRAKSLWDEGSTDGWEARLAEVYDSLLDMPKMEPLLRLELARRFLDLALNTSAGLLEVIDEQPPFKEILSLRAINLKGNWLDPGQNKALAKPRGEAAKLLDNSPKLGPLVAEAKARGGRRVEASRRGIALVGWICRDDEGRPRWPASTGRR